MSIPLDAIRRWTSPTYFEEGKRWFETGKVEQVARDGDLFEGRLSIRDRAQLCRFRLDDSGHPHSECPCRVSRMEGMVCGHVIALVLAWRADNADPLAEREARVAERLAIPPERRRGGIRLGPTGIPAKLRLSLRRAWPEEAVSDKLHLIPAFEVNGRQQRPDQLHASLVMRLEPAEEKLLLLLEDIAGTPLPPVFPLTRADFAQVLSWRSPGNIHVLDWPAPIRLHDGEILPMLTVDLCEKSGELLLHLQLDLPKPPPPGTSPLVFPSPGGGWVIAGENAWPLAAAPPPELQGLCAGSVRVPRAKVMSFLKETLPTLEEVMLVENRVDASRFRTSKVSPRFKLSLKGGDRYASGTLRAVYGDVEVGSGGPDPGKVLSLPDPADPLAYGGRNLDAEAEALERLSESGFAARSGDNLGALEGKTAILNLLARARHEFEPAGWEIELRGDLGAVAERAAFLLAKMEIAATDTPDWFHFGLTLRTSRGTRLTEAALRKALERGESFLEMDGEVVLLPRRQAEAIVDAVAEAKPAPDGGLRLPRAGCGFVAARLGEAEGLPVDADPAWLEEAKKQNQEVALEAVELPEHLRGVLRPYQEYGVRWLRFLETAGFGGILADDMGLGKTLQTLAWLSLSRTRAELTGAPALIVCPASLVENWVEETAKFLPELKAVPIHGTKRDQAWDQARDADLAVISYGMLRRDAKRAADIHWSAVVLDEAQHIKNPGTQNARAAKTLRAGQRLVLTGTPMENQVRDLWSLMDFLMPGYLGTAAKFQKRFGAPIASGGPGAASAMHLLRRKIRPFLLRRLKQDVAADLPPRLEKRVYCDLTPPQRALYDATEAEVRAEAEAAMREGKPQLSILRGLMRLRQICCHPALLPDNRGVEESGKTDMFLELLDEVIDGGHRALVFSQFTSMLGRLRGELEARGIQHAYLDGSTQNRQTLVNEFNANEDIPVFLISLMAGGTGLNLTGADVVIHHDPWWNPAVEDQATDRAHRIGQQRAVYAMKLITRDTIESRVALLQDKKRELIEHALTSDEAVMERLGWEDVKALLEM